MMNINAKKLKTRDVDFVKHLKYLIKKSIHIYLINKLDIKSTPRFCTFKLVD